MCFNTQTHREIEVLTGTSYCFNVYAFTLNKFRYYSQVLVHSTVVNSCDSPQYILTFAFIMQFRKLKHLLD